MDITTVWTLATGVAAILSIAGAAAALIAAVSVNGHPKLNGMTSWTYRSLLRDR